jgi:activator of HSP90 ATPase
MALLGQGDARWIVQEREDGTNVGAWHWSEKKRTNLAKDRLTAALLDLQLFQNEVGTARITAVDSVAGEVTVNNRKNKLYIFYELTIKAQWEATLEGKSGDEATVKGEVNLPEFGVADDDFEVEWSVKGKHTQGDAVKTFLKKGGSAIVKQTIMSTLMAIKDEAGASANPDALTSESSQDGSVSSMSTSSTTTASASSSSSSSSSVSKTAGATPAKEKTKTFKTEVIFSATADDLYTALTEPNHVAAFTGSRVEISQEAGGRFSLFDGSISGTQVELTPGKKIVQKWRSSEWPDGHFSTVTITLADYDDGCHLSLVQQGVPASDYERTSQGWPRFFWERIKGTFGYGSASSLF